MTPKIIKVGEDTGGITIGRRGENEARVFGFDITSLISEFGEGEATLLVKRPKDTSAYPVATTRDENIITWVVSSADTAYEGHGECELFWYVDTLIAKSFVWNTFTGRDIGEEGEAPEPQQGWVTQMLEQMQTIADSAQASADSASESATEASTILANTIYIDENGQFHIQGE